MSTEILVNIGPQETRVALVDGGVVQEAYVQRASRQGVVGNIYKGRVQRVLPGMQAAFIEIGLERTAFLHASDMWRGHEEGEEPPGIDSLLREGQEVIVQAIKDPLGSKGARLTTLISIPSRYLVLLPLDRHTGISAKIEDDAERERLQGMIDGLIRDRESPYGVIARTAAEGVDEPGLAAVLEFLHRLWAAISAHAEKTAAGQQVHGDLPLSMRLLRDLLGTDIDRVRIDSEEEFQRVRQFARLFIRDAADRIEVWDGAGQIFDLYGVEDEINRALHRKVELKSGGHLMIDQTEAMTTIDVNTGAFTGHRNLEETILRTNLEAAQAISRQLRLRNLGGLVIIDFIDMRNDEHRSQVLRALERGLARDPARTHVYPFSPLGLVEMTRKRTRESLGHILCESCPTCSGRGFVKAVDSVCLDIIREIGRSARQFEARAFLVIAAPRVITQLMEEQSFGLAELEEQLQRPIRVQAEAEYLPENFDVVPL